MSGWPYVAMELLEPYELPTSERAIARCLLDVCAAVAELHARGIVHRDLKPANVMRRATGEVVLVDVGLAKDIGASARPRTDVTVFGGKLAVGGTPVERDGIRYRLTGRRTYLNFPNLEKPFPWPRNFPRTLDPCYRTIEFGGPSTWVEHALRCQEEAGRQLLDEARR